MGLSNNVIITTITLMLILLFIVPGHLRPANFLHDDAYFYLQVAYNIVNGHGSTFNQVTSTNGYHPLWMLLCIGGFFISGGDKLVALHVIFAIQSLLFLGLVLVYYKIVKLISLRFWYIALPFLSAYFLTGLYGSEAHINALMLTLSLYYFLLAITNKKTFYWFVTSIFLGLAVLARLDNIFIVGSALFFGLVGQRDLDGKTLIRVVFAATLPCFILIISYVLYNFISYGHAVPISGALKSSFPSVTARIDNLGYLGKIVFFFGVLSLIFSFKMESHELRKTLLRVMGTGVLLHACYVVLFTDYFTQQAWYYVSGVLNMVLFLCAACEFMAGKAKHNINLQSMSRFVILCVVFLTLAGIARGWYKAYNPGIHRGGDPFFFLRKKLYDKSWPNELAVWMKHNLQTQSAIIVYDCPGVIAYYSDLKILPLDGLMNDYAYNDKLLSLGINKYISLNNVGYYLGPVLSSGESYRRPWMNAWGGHGMQEIEVYAPLYRKSAGKIIVLDRNIVCRSRALIKHPLEPPIALWKIENAGRHSTSYNETKSP